MNGRVCCDLVGFLSPRIKIGIIKKWPFYLNSGHSWLLVCHPKSGLITAETPNLSKCIIHRDWREDSDLKILGKVRAELCYKINATNGMEKMQISEIVNIYHTAKI